MKELRIKDICDKGSSNLKQKDVEGKNGLYPVYGASGIISHIDTYHQEENYIAIVKDGSGIGRVTFMPAKSSVIGTMQYILPKEGFNINYIGYCLQSLDLSKYKQGAAIPHIYFRDYGERIVKVTESINEQQSIVDYLDSAFAKIDAMKANAEKALNEAKALFQASLKEMLEPKEGWEEKKFGKICDFVRGPFGGSLKKECFKDSGYAVYEQQNAIYNKFSFRYFIDEEKYNSLIRFKVNAGDLIMSCSGTIGKVAIIPETFKEGIINQALLKLTPNKDIDAHFLKYLMESNLFKEIINANIEGVAIKNIASVAVLKEIKLYIPKVSEQQKIVVEIDSLKSKVDRLLANYDKISQECDALKQAILRQVFE